MPVPTNREPAAEVVPTATKADELVSKHSYPFRQTSANPVTEHQPEPSAKNADTFVAPKASEPQEAPNTPQKLPKMFTDPGRVEWMTQNEASGAVATQTVFKRFFAAEQAAPPEEPQEPQEEDNALGCSEAVDAPDGGQGIGPVEMDWIFALCNGLPVPEDKRQAIARAIHNILDTRIHQTIIESISGSDERIAKFLNEAERETSANSNNTNTARS